MREVEIVARDVGRVGVAMKLRAVVALHRCGEFVEERHEIGGRLVGRIDGQTLDQHPCLALCCFRSAGSDMTLWFLDPLLIPLKHHLYSDHAPPGVEAFPLRSGSRHMARGDRFSGVLRVATCASVAAIAPTMAQSTVRIAEQYGLA